MNRKEMHRRLAGMNVESRLRCYRNLRDGEFTPQAFASMDPDVTVAQANAVQAWIDTYGMITPDDSALIR